MSVSPTPAHTPSQVSRPSAGRRIWRSIREQFSWKLRVALFLLLVLVVGLGLACLFPVVPVAVAWGLGIWLLVALTALGLLTGLAKSTIVVLLLGTVLNAAYFSYTSHGERNFDVSHQVKYVRYMVEHKTAPPDAYCFICHHPPLFYASAAVAHEIGRGLRLPEPLRASQAIPFLSVILMGLSATFLTRRFSPSVATTNLATALMLCWPYTLVMSGRIHNDSLASGLMVAGIYACVRWFQDQDSKSLILAAVLSALSVLTKTNGYVLVILLFCSSALVWYQSREKMNLLKRKGPILLLLVLALGSYASNRGSARQYDKEEEDKQKKAEEKKKEEEKKAKEKKEPGKGAKAPDAEAAKAVEPNKGEAAKPEKKEKQPAKDQGDPKKDEGGMKKLSPEELAKLEEDNKKLSLAERLLGSAGKIGARSWMGNEPFNYLYFDLESFLKYPYVLARHDGSGRQFFWNHVLKSSLFSTHNHRPDYETSYRLNRKLAALLNGVFLAMLVFMICSLPKVKKEHQWKYSVLILAGLGFLGGGAAFRILIPHSHHSDFRHMYPVLLPMVVAYALMVEAWRRDKQVMHWVGLWLALLMLAGTMIYYLPKHQWMLRNSPQHYVVKSSQDVSRYAKEESSWNEYQYVVLEPTERLWVDFKGLPTAYGISLATDHNDIYEVRIYGSQETRVFDVGMKKAAGIAHYKEHLVPPVQGVRAIEIRPRAGDWHYSVGHLILNPYGYNSAYVPPASTKEGAPKQEKKKAGAISQPVAKADGPARQNKDAIVAKAAPVRPAKPPVARGKARSAGHKKNAGASEASKSRASSLRRPPPRGGF